MTRLRMPKPDSYIDQSFIEGVVALWDRKFDTWEIAKTLGCDEATASIALRLGREQRRGKE